VSASHDEDQAVERTHPYPEAARRLGVSRRHLERLVAAGAIRHVRSGGRVLFRDEDIEAYLDAQARGGSPVYASVARDRITR